MTVAVPRVNLFVTNFSMKRTLALSLDLKICDALEKKRSEGCSINTHRFEPVLQCELLSLVILEQSLSNLKRAHQF